MNELYKTRTIKESKSYKMHKNVTRVTSIVIRERDGIFYVYRMGESYINECLDECYRMPKYSRSTSKTFTNKSEALKFYNK